MVKSNDWDDEGYRWASYRRQPEDMARSVERDRLRFTANIVIDPTPWEIARLLSDNDRYNEAREGLRGVLDMREEGKYTFIWWKARYASHHQGALMLNLPVARSGDNKTMEVEVNIDEDGTLYIQYPNKHPLEHRLKKTRMFKNLVDGMLAVRGRIIVLDDGRPRLQRAGEDFKAAKEALGERRMHFWRDKEKEADRWSAMRRTHLPDGSPVPQMSVIRPYRAFVRYIVHSWMALPVAKITINDDSSIKIEWRRTASVARIHFKDGHATIHMNDDGLIREIGPEKWKNPYDVNLLGIYVNLARFDDYQNKKAGEENDLSQAG